MIFLENSIGQKMLWVLASYNSYNPLQDNGCNMSHLQWLDLGRRFWRIFVSQEEDEVGSTASSESV